MRMWTKQKHYSNIINTIDDDMIAKPEGIARVKYFYHDTCMLGIRL